MKAKIQAGAELDIASPREVHGIVTDALADHWRDMTEGVVYKTVSTSVIALASGGTAMIGGPDPGFTWSVRRVSVSAGTAELHLNDSAPSTFVATVTGCATFGDNSFVVKPGNDVVAINPSGGTVSFSVNLAVCEVPADQEWKL